MWATWRGQRGDTPLYRYRLPAVGSRILFVDGDQRGLLITCRNSLEQGAADASCPAEVMIDGAIHDYVNDLLVIYSMQ